MKIITVLLLITLSTISFAKGQSGSGKLVYDPKEQLSEGFEIQVDYKWALSSLMNEPLRGMVVSWSYGDLRQLVPVSFKEMQNGEIIHTMAPRQVVEQCYPITIELTAELKNRRGVTLSIDGGAISSSGDSYNVKGSPAWNKLFKRFNTFMPKLKAQELFYDEDLELNFTGDRSKVVFNLHPLKEWYARSQLNKRVQTYCDELNLTYSNLKKVSNKFPYAMKKAKLDTYCSLPGYKVVSRLKSEIKKLNDQDFIKSYFEGQEVTKAITESSRAYKSAESKTSKLHDMGGDVQRIIEKSKNEKKRIEKIVEAQLEFDEFEAAAVSQLESESGDEFIIYVEQDNSIYEWNFVASWIPATKSWCRVAKREAEYSLAHERDSYLEKPEITTLSCEEDPSDPSLLIFKYKWKFSDLTIKHNVIWSAAGYAKGGSNDSEAKRKADETINCDKAYSLRKSWGSPNFVTVDGKKINSKGTMDRNSCKCSFESVFHLGAGSLYRKICNFETVEWWDYNYVQDSNMLSNRN